MESLDTIPIEELLGREVYSVLEQGWRGQITRITIGPNGRSYECSYFNDGGPRTGAFFGCELKLSTNKMGFDNAR